MNPWYEKLYGPESHPLCGLCASTARVLGPLHGPCQLGKPVDNTVFGVERWGGWPLGDVPPPGSE